MKNDLTPFIKVILIDDQPETLIGINGFPEVVNDSDNGDERFTDIGKYFQVKWLQNMNDIKEYRNLCHEVEDLYGASFLGINGWVPEIVCFDYALSPGKNENTGIPEHIKKSNPNLLLIEYSQKYRRLARSFSDKEKNEIKAPRIREVIEQLQLSNPDFSSLNNTEKLKKAEEFLKENRQLPFYEPIVRSVNGKDNMGCFGGGLIVSQFRKHPCVGIPTTSKEAASIEGNEAEFFEWLIEDDLNNTFFHGVKTQKWTVLLPKAVENLRLKIKNLVSGNKITLALGQVMQLANGKIQENDNEQIFTFNSDFGKHSLPLIGLFIDVAVENRKEEIKIFFSELLNQVIENTKAGMNVEILTDALKTANVMMKEYKDNENLFKRLRLSELKFLEKNIGSISTLDKTELENLCKYFNEKKKYFDLGEFKFGSNDRITKRYAVLFTMLEIYKIYHDYVSENKNVESHLEIEPTVYDYVMGIFPRPENPQILPYHDAKRLTDLTDKKLVSWTGIKINAILGSNKATMKVDDGSMLTEEEKLLLKAYYLGLFSAIENDGGNENRELKYPSWIN